MGRVLGCELNFVKKLFYVIMFLVMHMNKEIEDLVNKTINNNSLVKINDALYLKKYQMEMLTYYHIEYQNCSSVSEILFLIDEALDNEEVEDYDKLEELALSLQEFQYYHNTNK